MTNITYTFPTDCPIPQLRGVTVTGGQFCRLDGQRLAEPDAVRFATLVDGNAVTARIAGKPELETLLADHLAAKAAKANRLAELGWDEYKQAQRAAVNARAAYDRASEYGYPAREAKAMHQADEALKVVAAQHPGAAAYAIAEAYSLAANDTKASAGRDAMRAIEQGDDPVATVTAMQARWSADAGKAVDNA
jgi:hypothetical protein